VDITKKVNKEEQEKRNLVTQRKRGVTDKKAKSVGNKIKVLKNISKKNN
jgi:hypothetical protein